MSINITVHGNTLEKVARKTVLSDPEYVKREQLHERRKQRLEQVRQQSKVVAQHVRKNVEDEIKRQEKRIEEQKHKELLEWREKALAQAQQQQKKGLAVVGAAHRAALDEREAEAKLEKEKTSRIHTALQRGKEALQRNKDEKGQRQPKERRIMNMAKPTKQSTSSQTGDSKVEKSTFVPTRLEDVEEESSVTSVEENDSKSSALLKRNKTVLMDINTDSDDSSSSISLLDSHADSNRHFYRTKEKSDISELTKSSYNARDYRHSDTSASDKSNSVEKPNPRQFTKISELVQKRKSKVNVNSFDIPRPAEMNGTPVKSCLKSNPQQESAVSTIKTQTQDTLKASIYSKPRSETSNSVQFYDYDNKFAKKYEQKQGTVKPISKPKSQMNAMDRAQVELQLQEKEKERMIGMRQKAEERGKRALETEKIRRDCEVLKHQLTSLNRDYGFLCGNETQEPKTTFAAKQLNDAAIERQKTFVSAVDNQKSKPVEKIVNKRTERKPEVGHNVNKTPTANETNTTSMRDNAKNADVISSIDSCASVFLGYVNKQSEQVSEDIKHCKDSSTLKELRHLLEKINNLRDEIIREIENFKANNEGMVDIKKIAQLINDLRREREEILSDEKENIEFMKKMLEKREQRLKEKEKHMKRKLIQIAESQLATETAKAEEFVREKTGTTESDEHHRVSYPVPPIEIIIKLRNETLGKQSKSPFKSPRKRSSLIHDFKHSKRKRIVSVKQKSTEVDENKTAKITDVVSPAKSRSSTSYMSPPDVMHTELGQILSVPTVSDVPLQRKEPEKKSKPIDIAADRVVNKNNVNADIKDKKMNPVLTHYIQRLLGMSRSSIDMLGVSSSEVETPTSSLIANPANTSETDSLLVQDERLRRLQEFINDNYSFISDLEESLKSSKSNSSSTCSSYKFMEKIWMEALKKEEQKMNVARLEKQLKSILKKKSNREEFKRSANTPRKIKCKKSVETQVSDIPKSEKSVEAYLPFNNPKDQIPEPARSDKAEHLVDKYTKLTQNCTKRIAELTDMIQKVRKEKQKILEITLTSSSEKGDGSTDYKDLPELSTIKSVDGSPYKLEDLQTAIEVHQESDRVGLEKNKLTGVSRDSGISLSRPVTALDSHEINEVHRQGKSPDQDILKIASLLPKVALEEACKTLQRQQKHPPPSITRYSPQLVEERAHELSTILEVETPATSRLNASTSEKNILPLSFQLMEKSIKKFQTFEEFIAQQKLDVSQFIDIDSNSKFGFEELEDIINKGNLKYEEFPSINTYMNDRAQAKDTPSDSSHVTQQLERADYQPFPSHKSYVAKLGISGLLDSQSILAVSVSDHSQKPEDTDSTESLPDVVAELKQRKILTHSFRNEIGLCKPITSSESSSSKDNGGVGTKMSSTSDKTPLDKNIATRTTELKSPTKPKLIVTSQSDTDKPEIARYKSAEMTGIEHLPSSTSKSSSQDDSESLGKELSEMGLKWASLMLKKSQQSMELGSTSSSFTYEHMRRKSPKKSPEKNKASSTSLRAALDKVTEKNKMDLMIPISDVSSFESGTKPFNLKEFFAKELQKRVALSASSNDDSLASQFIKSLLGSTHSTPTPKSDEKTPGERQRHHTSTPVYQKSSQSSKSSQEASKLFSGESYISSVRLSPKSKNANAFGGSQSVSQDSDNLSACNLQLNYFKRESVAKGKNNDKAS